VCTWYAHGPMNRLCKPVAKGGWPALARGHMDGYDQRKGARCQRKGLSPLYNYYIVESGFSTNFGFLIIVSPFLM
jgi:hypothetical protein